MSSDPHSLVPGDPHSVIPEKGARYTNRIRADVVVEVISARQPQFAMGMVIYRRIGSTRRTSLNLSRFHSLYAPESRP